MLEKVDLQKTVDKETYKQVSEELGERLGLLQRKCKAEKIPVVIVFEGLGAAGKGVQINRLIQSFDPRGFDVYASRKPGEEERMRPFLWRYWTKTPEDGRIAIFDRSWYDKVTVDRFDKVTKRDELPGAFADITSFEKQLTDGGCVIIKLFLYISQKEQKKRFEKLTSNKETEWRVSDGDWERNKKYDKYLMMNEEMLQQTDTGYAPWTIIEATDKNYAAMKILATVADRMEYEVNRREAGKKETAVMAAAPAPQDYKVNPTAAPNDIEKVHHYLWRFWNNMPKAGHIAIFDRTWYGRVMVERIEGFCKEEDWRRAYQEINEMEAHMANFGAVVLKFWLHIDKEEQERRFNQRMNDPAKQWKITDEDWRNREKWDAYEAAVNEMLVRTSTTYAPWTIVEGNSKYYARVKVLKTVVEALEQKIKEVEKERNS